MEKNLISEDMALWLENNCDNVPLEHISIVANAVLKYYSDLEKKSEENKIAPKPLAILWQGPYLENGLYLVLCENIEVYGFAGTYPICGTELDESYSACKREENNLDIFKFVESKSGYKLL